MSKHYLSEDIRQIQKYFPGARATALHTPFDLTDRPSGAHKPARPQVGITSDPFRENSSEPRWYGDLAWNR